MIRLYTWEIQENLVRYQGVYLKKLIALLYINNFSENLIEGNTPFETKKLKI